MISRPLLLPLVPLYRLAVGVRNLRLKRGWEAVQALRRPVVSIGNLSAGGSGKTPFTIALAQALMRQGLAVSILSRGYGRLRCEPAQVDPAGRAEEFGDEPLLIARSTNLPVYVAAQRYNAGLLAEAAFDSSSGFGASAGLDSGFSAAKPQVCLLDDGFQHRQLARTVDLLLVSNHDLDDHLLPAGNLREPLSALLRASAFLIPADEPEVEARLRARGFTAPVFRISRSMQVPVLNTPVVAFCGIARPGQFFAGLEEAGLHLADCRPFADHHRYTPDEFAALLQQASRHNAQLITTEKDSVRLGPLLQMLPAGSVLHTAPLSTIIQNEPQLLEWLVAKLS